MKFSKEEKKFWQRHFRIQNPSAIKSEWGRYEGIDSEEDDAYFRLLSLRVSSIHELHLKETLITDEALHYISKFENLSILYLRRHRNITKKSIPFFNEMAALKSLNITKTQITLSDLVENLDNPSLKEVFLSSVENEEDILEKGFILKGRMPGCNIYLDTSFTTDVIGNSLKPIF